MSELTGRERIDNILNRKPVDRIGLFEHFWGDTRKKWAAQAKVSEDEDLATHFGFDMGMASPLKMVADLNHVDEILEEDEETQLVRTGNYAHLRRHKLHNATPEHVDFEITNRSQWEERIRPQLTPSRERIDFEPYRAAVSRARDNDRFFALAGILQFERMHPVCGHEHMLMGMAIDPDWIKDMVNVYADLQINLMEMLFAEEGKPDGAWFYEDMGFKNRPFMSPEMYREIIQPGHKKVFDFCHSQGLKVIVHSCGFIEPLVPGMIEAGMDCLQVIEVKAGMDPIKLKRLYGDDIALCGGMDARNLVANDLDAIKDELETKIPVLKEGYGYILHSDHSIPDTCDYETYQYFVDRGLELGRY